MKAEAVEAVIRGLKRAGVSVATYLPDSLLKELYPALDADPDIRTIPVTNEGEGAAIAGGVFLSGKRAVLVMENSGLRAATEHLARAAKLVPDNPMYQKSLEVMTEDETKEES